MATIATPKTTQVTQANASLLFKKVTNKTPMKAKTMTPIEA